MFVVIVGSDMVIVVGGALLVIVGSDVIYVVGGAWWW